MGMIEDALRKMVKTSVQEKVTALVESRFASDQERAFQFYDADKNAVIDTNELETMLNDAGVAVPKKTNAEIAAAMMGEMNTDGFSGISWTELKAALEAG